MERTGGELVQVFLATNEIRLEPVVPTADADQLTVVEVGPDHG